MKAQNILIWIFLLLITVPGMLFIPFAMNPPKTYNLGNETKQDFPVISDYSEFPQEFENFYNNNVAFRRNIIELNALVDFFTFHCTNNGVYTGKDGWFFYNKSDGDNPLMAYSRGTSYTNDNLAIIAANLLQIKTICQENGAQFYLVLAPNKEEVYGRYIGDDYTKTSSKRKYSQLVNYIRGNTDINLVDLQIPIENNKGQYQLYYKTDTHWNNIGGFLTAQYMIENMGIQAINDHDIKFVEGEPYVGDLAFIADIQDYVESDIFYNVLGYGDDVLVTGDNLGYYRLDVVEQSNVGNGQRLLMYRDSFAIAMIPNISKNFDQSHYILDLPGVFDQNGYNLSEILRTEKPTVVVIEMVERYSDQLLFTNIY